MSQGTGSKLQGLFNNNRRWAQRINTNDPEFFAKLAAQQSPEYLWIGCSDSRVPANEIVDLLPVLALHRRVSSGQCGQEADHTLPRPAFEQARQAVLEVHGVHGSFADSV